MKIAILGGTGNEGFGLGFRWAAAGHEIIIGSRKTEKGESAAADMKERLPEGKISGTNNPDAAQQADVVVLSVPYWAQAGTLESVKEVLANKLLITVVAPTGEKAARVYRLESGLSAAEEAQNQLEGVTRVVAAFQNIGAHHLLDLAHQLDCDVLICGEQKEDKQVAMQLCQDAGLHGVNAGALQNARAVEELTAVLIAINIIHKVKSAGIRITGLA
ncbi:MAG: NADPH-dependent F420 reductase [Ardenticatenaceae bacterium]|nr:NADPH-dependent F420 reductase [Ardenticatenaceae bacterium]MCB9442844.1 NADPH-dependent F420 reductase [Ardenticatenaceae bacterium]